MATGHEQKSSAENREWFVRVVRPRDGIADTGGSREAVGVSTALRLLRRGGWPPTRHGLSQMTVQPWPARHLLLHRRVRGHSRVGVAHPVLF